MRNHLHRSVKWHTQITTERQNSDTQPETHDRQHPHWWCTNNLIIYIFLCFCLFCACKSSAKWWSPKSKPKEEQESLLLRCLKCLVWSRASNFCASLNNRHYILNISYIFIIKYIHSSESADIQLLLVQWRYFRSHYLAQHLLCLWMPSWHLFKWLGWANNAKEK